MKLEEMRMKGKVETKKVENKGKKSVTKIKMGQPDTDTEEPVDAMAVEEEMLMVPEQAMPQEQMPQQMTQQAMPEEEEVEEVEEEGGEEMEGEEK